MELRPATMDDAETLFGWRNDPDTRANSVNPDPVPWEDHRAWLQASIDNPDRDLLVAEVDGQPVGTIRIDRGEETELSWTVGRHFRGMGFGKMMVAEAIPECRVIAKIKEDNGASKAIAISAGFMLRHTVGDLQTWARSAQPDYLEIIDRIEAIRGKNNKNWMDLLRLAFKHAPDEAANIMAGIYKEDQEISRLVGNLTRT